jgi:DNA-binding CsgD family transcriptional regulator
MARLGQVMTRNPRPSPPAPLPLGASGAPAAFAGVVDDDLERLARRLIRGAAAAAAVGSPVAERHRGGSGAEDVLLDVEVEGVRCIVVRRAPPASNGGVGASGASGAGGPAAAREDAPEVALSPREREIARMVACGYPNKTIAGVLEISTWTVSTHLRRIFAKLAVTSRAAMAAQLAAAGLMGSPRGKTGALGVPGFPCASPTVPPRRPAP